MRSTRGLASAFLLVAGHCLLVSNVDAQASSGAVASGDALLRSGKFKEAIQQYSLGVQLDRESHVALQRRLLVDKV